MPQLLQRLLHEVGNGRAIANARAEQLELGRVFAEVDALAGRLRLFDEQEDLAA